ncbi:hypothetical protein MUB23_17320 [Cuneatibacter sp. NSJ-177]|uniref:ABC-three component system middle component 6 n=1 Tax=Cuneatibacter sp. NSJ-177 TaxID=2931401 RepID=UPI001FD48AF3|nr:ABC-three component system middle component 6 [Cuneatibacter sp. NSJ-177]MCJ7837138.1 hypothetical protein [Cuneatibacter sp. NSJ-177]
MIINVERAPELSLYYLGGIILKILNKDLVIGIDELLAKVKLEIDENIHIDFLYYTLDWLFLLSLIKLDEGKVYYANKKVNSA